MWLLLAACSPTATVYVDVDESAGEQVHLTYFQGSCAVPGERIPALFGPPELAPGTYAIVAVLLDECCQQIGSGCADLEVPAESNETINIVRQSATECIDNCPPRCTLNEDVCAVGEGEGEGEGEAINFVDDFERNVMASWNRPDGLLWSPYTDPPAVAFSVVGGRGRINLPAGGYGDMTMISIPLRDVEASATVSMASEVTGGESPTARLLVRTGDGIAGVGVTVHFEADSVYAVFGVARSNEFAVGTAVRIEVVMRGETACMRVFPVGQPEVGCTFTTTTADTGGRFITITSDADASTTSLQVDDVIIRSLPIDGG
jgi:hypothetical protein